ncbi:putative Rep [Circoviridae TM-6c]|uniref:Replication-associated protein n=1 Tax=Circoviridae TM-6c TaxID=795382 RepID=D9IZ82_9VIRU|nr:putative Rep [Circoviridae TM-6c]
MQSVNWCFTLNNYTNEDVNKLKQVKCRYICLGFEVGDKKQTPHIQGFIQFEKKVRLSVWKKINKKIHAEIMKGTIEQAINYCKKSGTFEERGEIIKMGERRDLKEAKKKCAEVGLRAITDCESTYNLQVIRNCQIMLEYHEKERDFKPEVIWIYGESGAGKTKYISEKCAEVDTYWKDATKWWNGYDRHEITVMDDFRASNMKMNELLKLIDRYPHRVEIKGGFRQMLSKKIYISSIMHPKDVYNLPEEPVKQLLRRIDTIIKI